MPRPMKQLFVLSLIVISFFSYGQEYAFLPKWKTGDTKTVTMERRETEFRDGEIYSDTLIYNDARLKVLGEDKENYQLQIQYENVALKAAMELYEKMGQEMPNYKELSLVYNVNKKTGASELANWEEVQKFMNESFDLIAQGLSENVPEMAAFSTMIFTPIKEIFKSKENVESYMNSEIGYLLAPFGQTLEVGKTNSVTESTENPFNKSSEIESTTNITLLEVDKAAHNCIINQEIELDLTEFKEMIKNMVQKMAQSFGAEDSTAQLATDKLDDFEMDMTNQQHITFDFESTWVTKVETTVKVTASVPGEGKRVNEVHSKVTVQ